MLEHGVCPTHRHRVGRAVEPRHEQHVPEQKRPGPRAERRQPHLGAEPNGNSEEPPPPLPPFLRARAGGQVRLHPPGGCIQTTS